MSEPTTASAPVRDSPVEAVDVDRRLTLYNISWAQYEAMRTLLDDVAGLDMTYLEGTLELMSPSRRHEQVKTLVARLVEIFALERGLPLNGYGNMTFKKEAKKRGLEPDECWSLGEMKEVPDIAFEAVITTGDIDKLEVYVGPAIPEVWFWRDGKFRIYEFGGGVYRERAGSAFLPDLDFALLARFAEQEDQTAAVRAFRDALRARK